MVYLGLYFVFLEAIFICNYNKVYENTFFNLLYNGRANKQCILSLLMLFYITVEANLSSPQCLYRNISMQICKSSPLFLLLIFL